MNYKVTDYDLISKGRVMILEKMTAGDASKVKDVFHYVADNADTNYLAFYLEEELFLAYWTGEFQIILEEALKADTHFYYRYSPPPWPYDAKHKNRILPGVDSFLGQLRSKVVADKDIIIRKIESSGLSKMDQDFLKITLDYLLLTKKPEYRYYSEDDVMKGLLNEDADSYLAEFPNSPYERFVRKTLRYRYKTNTLGSGIAVSAGTDILRGQLKDRFSRPFALGFDVEIWPWRFVTRYTYKAGFSSLKDSIRLEETTWPASNEARFHTSEFDLGFAIVDSRSFRIAPYAGIAGIKVRPPDKDRDSIPGFKRIEIERSRAFVLGTTVDIKIRGKQYKVQDNFPDQVYSYIRLRYAYYSPSFSQTYPGLSGNIHTFTICFGGFMRSAHRTP